MRKLYIKNISIKVRLMARILIDYGITITWVLVSHVTKKITMDISSTIVNRSFKTMYYIVPNEQNYILHNNVNLRDTSVLGKPFLIREFGASVIEINARQISRIRFDESSVFVTYLQATTYDFKWFIYFAKILKLAFKIRMKGMPVLVIMGDCFYPDAASLCQVLTSLTGGCVLVGPNTPKELMKYGYSNVIWPFMFLEIIHKIFAAKSSQTPFIDRQDICLIAGGPSAAKTRQQLMSDLSRSLTKNSLKVVESDGSLKMDNYIESMGNAKFYATTNLVQEIFFIGPKFYQKKICRTTLTGRTYNAFAAGMVLITNECDSLKEMGFIKGVHYLDLEQILSTDQFILPSEELLSKIADNGRANLLKVINNKVDFKNTTMS